MFGSLLYSLIQLLKEFHVICRQCDPAFRQQYCTFTKTFPFHSLYGYWHWALINLSSHRANVSEELPTESSYQWTEWKGYPTLAWTLLPVFAHSQQVELKFSSKISAEAMLQPSQKHDLQTCSRISKQSQKHGLILIINSYLRCHVFMFAC